MTRFTFHIENPRNAGHFYGNDTAWLELSFPYDVPKDEEFVFEQTRFGMEGCLGYTDLPEKTRARVMAPGTSEHCSWFGAMNVDAPDRGAMNVTITLRLFCS